MKLLEMQMLTEMWVDRTDYHHTQVVQGDLPTPRKGEIPVAVANLP